MPVHELEVGTVRRGEGGVGVDDERAAATRVGRRRSSV